MNFLIFNLVLEKAEEPEIKLPTSTEIYTLSLHDALPICTIALISHASKVMLKILQARLQQYVNCELPDVQAGFRKGRGTRDQIANICWIMEKLRLETLRERTQGGVNLGCTGRDSARCGWGVGPFCAPGGRQCGWEPAGSPAGPGRNLAARGVVGVRLLVQL